MFAGAESGSEQATHTGKEMQDPMLPQRIQNLASCLWKTGQIPKKIPKPVYSQTPLIRPSLVRLNGSPAINGLKQIFPY